MRKHCGSRGGMQPCHGGGGEHEVDGNGGDGVAYAEARERCGAHAEGRGARCEFWRQLWREMRWRWRF
eukprot:3622442-Pleurochrysis_carterae.AAC.1